MLRQDAILLSFWIPHNMIPISINSPYSSMSPGWWSLMPHFQHPIGIINGVALRAGGKRTHISGGDPLLIVAHSEGVQGAGEHRDQTTYKNENLIILFLHRLSTSPHCLVPKPLPYFQVYVNTAPHFQYQNMHLLASATLKTVTGTVA